MNRWLTPAIVLGFAASDAMGNLLWQSSRRLAMEPTDVPTDAPTLTSFDTLSPTSLMLPTSFPTSSTTSVEDDSVIDSVKGIDPFEVGTKYLERCSGINLERDDCVVSTTLHTFASMMSPARRLQEGCTFPESKFLELFNGVRDQCVEKQIEYTDEEFEARVNTLVSFFGAEDCWNTMCGGGLESSQSYVTILLEEVAECANVHIESVNQCLWDQSFDILFFEGADGIQDGNETEMFDEIFPARRSLLEDPMHDNSFRCSPSKAEVEPLIRTTIKEAKRRCLHGGEELTEGDIVDAHDELLSLFTAPLPCWGEGSIAGCDNTDDDGTSNDAVIHEGDGNDGLNQIEIGVKYIEQCAAVELPRYDCLVSTVLEMMTSMDREGAPRRRFLQEEKSCDDVVVSEDIVMELIHEARNQCSHKHIHYSEERFYERAKTLMTFFGAESCWLSLCGEPDEMFMMIYLEEVAVCASVDAIAVNQCLWNEMLHVMASESVSNGGDDDDLYSSEANIRRVLQTASGNATSGDDMCHLEVLEAEVASFLSHWLAEAGRRCTMLGEELGQADINVVFTEFTKLLFPPLKCLPFPVLDESCDERSFDVIKKSQEEIDSSYMDFVHENSMEDLMQCAGIYGSSCVTSRSVELLMGSMQSCTTPDLGESEVIRIVNKALLECTAKSEFVVESHHHQAIDYLMQIVSSPDCWEDVCGNNDGDKHWWMAMCSLNDLGLLYSDSFDTRDEMPLDTEKLKCMVDYILLEKRGGADESYECTMIQLGPNVCGADFSLGIEAYAHCSDGVPPTDHFSMSYSFEQSIADEEDSHWARMLEYELSLSLSLSMSVGYDHTSPQPSYIDDDLSMSYSYDDNLSMSYGYNDDDKTNDDDLLHHGQAYEYVSEVCHLLELIHYNPVINDCMESMCDIKIDDVLARNYVGMPPTSNPTLNPSASPSASPTLLDTPTPQPTQEEGNFVSSPTSEPTSLPTLKPATASPTVKPVAMSPTSRPTTPKPSSKPTVKPTSKLTTGPTASPTKAGRGSVDVKFDVSVTLRGIKASELDFTALDAVINLLEKVFAQMLPQSAKVRLLKVGGVSVTRRLLRSLEDSEDGVDVEFEVIITKECDDATCSNSEDLSAAAYDAVTTDIKTKVNDGSLSTAIQEEAESEGVSELASVTVKPDSLVTGEAKVTVKQASTNDDEVDSASHSYSTALSIAVVSFSVLLFQCF